jgi:WD40 repeat protein
MWIQKLRQSLSGLAYSPDGATLYSLDYAGDLRRWDVATRAGRVLLHSGAVQDPEPRGRSLRVHHDGNRLLVFAYYFTVADAATGSYDCWEIPPEFPRYGSSLLSPDGRLLAVRDGNRAIITWDALARELGPVLREWPPRMGLKTFDLTPDGRTLAVLERRGHVSVIDLASGEARCRFRHGIEGYAYTLISPDGNTVVVHGERPGLEAWDASSGEQLCRTDQAWPWEAVALHPTRPICAAPTRKHALALFDLRSGEPVRTFDLRLGKRVMCATFSPDGLTCAAGGSSGRFAVFDVDE